MAFGNRSLPVERVRKLFDYDPITGRLTWRERPIRSRHDRRWNSLYSGVEAGGFDSSGYRKVSLDSQKYCAHRLIWAYMTGEWPSLCIDHADCDRGNNRWSNLRHATHQQNAANTSFRHNKSGYRGVHYDPVCKNYRAVIRVNNHVLSLGRFNDPKRAAAAYLAAAKKHFGEFARAY